MSEMMSMDLEGTVQFATKLDSMEREVQEVVASSLQTSFEHVMTDSKQNYCPVDTGHLKSSGYVKVNREGTDISVDIGYSAEYAAAVHEINKNYRNGKTWKYLEKPLNEANAAINDKMMADLSRWLMGV